MHPLTTPCQGYYHQLDTLIERKKKRPFNEGRAIPDRQLAPDGRENEPHITVKFGLHSADPQQVANLLKGIGPIRVKFGRISHFPPAPYSRGGAVLRYDIESPDLVAINALISDRLEVTDTYKHYVPHATIAYVLPGFVAKYEGDARSLSDNRKKECMHCF
ncbi:MAG: 2'-5' RNA ligase family protein [Phycisphaeraceae bacterium]|nr:2'-5' RNA ligase family protein [Phycisphaeraceae bacterium]